MLSREYAHRNQAGVHASRFRGEGCDLAEIREYTHGDDIRSMNWNVTARYRRPHVRVNTGEREQTVYLMVDRSASSTFGTTVSKEAKTLEVAATILYSVLAAGDAAGLVLFTDAVERFIPARKGTRHAATLVNTHISHRVHTRGTDIGAAAEFLLGRIRRRCSIVIISDFATTGDAPALALLAKRHAVRAVRVTDPHEQDLPDVGWISLLDPETGDTCTVDTGNPAVRERYRQEIATHDAGLTAFFAKHQIPAARVATDDAYPEVFRTLTTFFSGAA